MRKVIATILLALLVVSPVNAARLPDVQITGPSVTTFGAAQKFSVQYNTTKFKPSLYAKNSCILDATGELGLVEYQGLWATPSSVTFTLGPTFNWTGGSATCTVEALIIDGSRGTQTPIKGSEFIYRVE